MLKKVIKLLLAFILGLQIISPVIIASANERDEETDLVIDDSANQLETSEDEAIGSENDEEIDLDEAINPETEVDDTLIEDVEIEEESNENLTQIDDDLAEIQQNEAADETIVWTDEEIAIHNPLWIRFYEAANEAWDLFFYIEAMYLDDTLSEHPNGEELYSLMDAFMVEIINNTGSGYWYDMSLPFDHERNVRAFAEMNVLVELFEHFIAEFTAALDIDVSDEEVKDNDNDTRPTLPQTGTDIVLNTMLVGSGLVALGGLSVYKNLKKD